MNLNQLYYFKKLAENQHYTKTANELYISQPSLSYAISALEKELKAPLFEKSGRNIKLTKYGEIFYEYVKKSLDELELGINKVKNYTSIDTGTIEMGIIHTLSSQYIPDTVRSYLRDYPNMEFKIQTDKTENIIKGLKEHRYDIGFCGKINDPDLIFIPVMYQEFVAVVPLDHELANKEIISLEELVNYDLVGYLDELVIAKTVKDIFDEHGLTPHYISKQENELLIGGMINQGFGVGIAANTSFLKEFDLKIIPLDLKKDYRVIYLVYNKRDYLSEATENFINFIAINKISL